MKTILKRLAAIIVALACMLSITGITALAEGEGITLTVANKNVNKGSNIYDGDQFVVNVVVSGIETYGSLDMTLTYDSTKVELCKADGTPLTEWSAEAVASTCLPGFANMTSIWESGSLRYDDGIVPTAPGYTQGMQSAEVTDPFTAFSFNFVALDAGDPDFDIEVTSAFKTMTDEVTLEVTNPTIEIGEQHVAPTFTLEIAGEAKAGAELTAVIDAWEDNWGILEEDADFTYKWMADGEEIGTNAATYTLTAAEIGKTISVEVVATVEADENATATVDAEMESAVVADPEATASIDGEVTIDGTLKVGKTLTAKYRFVASVNGGEDASTFAWYTVDEDGIEAAIEGATDASYKLTNNEKDFKIKVVVTPKGEIDETSGTPVEATTEDTVAKATRPSGGTVGVGTVLPGVNEKPGTDEPGTETPGTDEPGTETPAPSAENFKDFPKENYTWAYDAVDTLVKAGVIEGKDAETFDPEGTTTNAEFLAMVIRAMGIETEDAAEGEHWATNIVAKATELGLLEHVEALENDAAITREEMFTILYKALIAAEKTVEAGDASEFTDAASISDFAVEATGALVKAGIVNGMGDGTVAPKGTGTRAQVATVIFRAFFK